MVFGVVVLWQVLHAAVMARMEGGSDLFDIGHRTHIDPGFRHRHDHIGMAKPERREQAHEQFTIRLLVVDDEQLIRWSLKDRLSEQGYRIIEADTAASAIARSEEGPVREVSWAELQRDVGAFAARMRQWGIGAGDRLQRRLRLLAVAPRQRRELECPRVAGDDARLQLDDALAGEAPHLAFVLVDRMAGQVETEGLALAGEPDGLAPFRLETGGRRGGPGGRGGRRCRGLSRRPQQIWRRPCQYWQWRPRYDAGLVNTAGSIFGSISADLTTSVVVRDFDWTQPTLDLTRESRGTDANGVPIASAFTIKPEKVDHFEAGFKTQFWDRKATFNVTGFWTEIKDFQASVSNGQLGTVRGYLANAEKVRSRGIEADLSLRPSDRFSTYANVAYTDATFEKFCDAPPPPELSGGSSTGIVVTGKCTYTGAIGAPGTPGAVSPPFVDISGSPLPGVSKWAAAWGAEFNLPTPIFGEEGQAYFGYDASYRSSWSSNPSPSIYTNVPGYSLHNFRVGFRTDRFDIFGWVRNAFDQDYVELLLAGTGGNTGLIAGQIGDPRTFGGTIKATF